MTQTRIVKSINFVYPTKLPARKFVKLRCPFRLALKTIVQKYCSRGHAWTNSNFKKDLVHYFSILPLLHCNHFRFPLLNSLSKFVSTLLLNSSSYSSPLRLFLLFPPDSTVLLFPGFFFLVDNIDLLCFLGVVCLVNLVGIVSLHNNVLFPLRALVALLTLVALPALVALLFLSARLLSLLSPLLSHRQLSLLFTKLSPRPLLSLFPLVSPRLLLSLFQLLSSCSLSLLYPLLLISSVPAMFTLCLRSLPHASTVYDLPPQSALWLRCLPFAPFFITSAQPFLFSVTDGGRGQW